MDYRKTNFHEKFTSASKYLDTTFDSIISVKFRESVIDYQVYDRLIEKLVIFSKANIKPIEGNFHGNAHLVCISNEKVIIVEHESGLEILYISGSIASFLGLIPLIIQLWKATHKRNYKAERPYDRYYRDEILHTEIRYFDNTGKLIEEKETELLGADKHLEKYLSSNDFLQRINEIILSQDARIGYLEEWIKIIEGKIDDVIKLTQNKGIKKKSSNK